MVVMVQDSVLEVHTEVTFPRTDLVLVLVRAHMADSALPVVSVSAAHMVDSALLAVSVLVLVLHAVVSFFSWFN